MITLIITDCQNDYLTGTMMIKGAKNKLEEIKKFIKTHRKDIDKIIFTVEWHPYNHMSFKRYGGKYPHHCIQFTPGACIEPKFLKYVQSLEIDYEVSTRGEIEELEQPGAFSDIDFVTDELGQRYYFDSLVTVDANTLFVICGVLDAMSYTINNLIKENIYPSVYVPGVISDKGDDYIKQFLESNKLNEVL